METKNTISGIIQSATPAVTKTGKPYSVINILSLVEEGHTITTVYCWNSDPKDFPTRSGILVSSYKETDGMLSCAHRDITLTTVSKELQDYLNRIQPIPSRPQWDKLCSALSDLIFRSPDAGSHSQVDCLKRCFDKLYLPYSTHTAARKHHHNWTGGLLQHTYELLSMFLALYPALPYPVNPFIVSMGCLFHDYGKIMEYTQDMDYKPAMFLQGHPFLSAEAAGQVLRSLKFDEHTIQHVQHSILAHHQRLEWGSPVLPATPEAYIVSMMDALSGTGNQYNVPSNTKALNTTIQRY